MIGKMDPYRRHQRRLLQAVLVSLASSLLACGPQPQSRGQPRNTPNPQVQADVLILPLGQKTKEELDYWTTESQRLVLSYFDIFLRHGFEQATTSRVTVAEDSFETDALEIAFQAMEPDGDPEWWCYVPLSGRVQHAGRYPDYVLIFDGLRFRIRGGGGARQTYDVPGSGKVDLDLDYLLWDNRNQQVAAYGKLHEDAITSSPHAASGIFQGALRENGRGGCPEYPSDLTRARAGPGHRPPPEPPIWPIRAAITHIAGTEPSHPGSSEVFP